MRLTLFLMLGISSLSACGPNRPQMTICFYNDEQHVSKCKSPDGKRFDCDSKCMDKHFTTPERDAEKLMNYVVELEKQAAKCN